MLFWQTTFDPQEKIKPMSKHGQMFLFAQVVQDGSFSEAARSLNLTPSAISKQINALEDRLGVRLLNRTTRKLNLTEAGQRYYSDCQRIITDILTAESEVGAFTDTPRGLLKVNAPVVMGARQIAPLLGEFQERYPLIQVQLTLTDQIVDLLDTGDDIALRIGQLADSSYRARKLCAIRRIVVAAPDYLKRHGAPKQPQDLLNHNCTRYSDPDHMNEWEFLSGEDSHMVRVSGNFISNNGEAHYYGALSGSCITRLASFLIAERLRRKELIPLLTDYDGSTGIYLWALYPETRHVPSKLRVFIDYLVEKLSPVPPWDKSL